LKRLNCNIVIGDYIFKDVVSVQIESGWDTFTDTATVEVRNKFKKDNKVVIVGQNNVFKRGDAVSIWLGYYPNPDTTKAPIFKGFISNVSVDKTVKITCQDSYLLKQINVESHYFSSATVKEICDYYIKGQITYDVIEVDLGALNVDNNSFINFIQLLEIFKENYSLFSWFENGVLKIQTPYLNRNGVTHKMYFNGEKANVIDNSLNYTRDDDFDVVVKAESILPDNTRVIRYAAMRKGEVHIQTAKMDGQQRNIILYNKTQAEIDEILTKQLPILTFEGFEGSFTTFGEPTIKHGDNVEMIDNKYSERNGTYMVKEVRTTFDLNGFRQQITPERKVQ